MIDSIISGKKKVGILGHVHPDGDCIGAVLGLYDYITENYPDISVKAFLEEYNASFDVLENTDKLLNAVCDEQPFDVFFALDCADEDRMGVAGERFMKADTRIVIDHHITNKGFGDINIIDPNASSTSELVYTLLRDDKISNNCAGSLYLGIVHDTGCFQYTCTGIRTMEIAARLMSKGIDFTSLIQDTFFSKSYTENKALGVVLSSFESFDSGRIVSGVLPFETIRSNGFLKSDTDGIVASLKNTKGCSVAVFITEFSKGQCKVSLRSNDDFDCASYAMRYGGGGHVKAAGFSVSGSDPYELKDKIVSELTDN